jgi:hypothetical protein
MIGFDGGCVSIVCVRLAHTGSKTIAPKDGAICVVISGAGSFMASTRSSSRTCKLGQRVSGLGVQARLLAVSHCINPPQPTGAVCGSAGSAGGFVRWHAVAVAVSSAGSNFLPHHLAEPSSARLQLRSNSDDAGAFGAASLETCVSAVQRRTSYSRPSGDLFSDENIQSFRRPLAAPKCSGNGECPGSTFGRAAGHLWSGLSVLTKRTTPSSWLGRHAAAELTAATLGGACPSQGLCRQRDCGVKTAGWQAACRKDCFLHSRNPPPTHSFRATVYFCAVAQSHTIRLAFS